MISQPGKSYREILGRVTATLGNNEAAMHIRSLRSTKDGKLLITMDKDQNACDELRLALNNEDLLKSGSLEGEETFHISGMSSNTSKEDVIEEVKRMTGK
ncbi:hypothetical protein JTB14_015231 [Gonioctena quinquepunctata]|nr:hypothetical protein JTB14_015231 [Gonioctena quinquepunctata]